MHRQVHGLDRRWSEPRTKPWLQFCIPWNEAPRYLIRDRDAIYGTAVTR